jgi:hypothetical protein
LGSGTLRDLFQVVQDGYGGWVATIYVNDHFGDWRSERSALLAECLDASAPGASFVRRLKPHEEDYFF